MALFENHFYLNQKKIPYKIEGMAAPRGARGVQMNPCWPYTQNIIYIYIYRERERDCSKIKILTP